VRRCQHQVVQNLPVQYVHLFGLCTALQYVRCQQFVVPDIIGIRTEAIIAKTVQRYCLGKTENSRRQASAIATLNPLKFAF
jgi:hypothetical protein